MVLKTQIETWIGPPKLLAIGVTAGKEHASVVPAALSRHCATLFRNVYRTLQEDQSDLRASRYRPHHSRIHRRLPNSSQAAIPLPFRNTFPNRADVAGFVCDQLRRHWPLARRL